MKKSPAKNLIYAICILTLLISVNLVRSYLGVLELRVLQIIESLYTTDGR